MAMNNYTETLFYHYILSKPDIAYKIKPEFFDGKNLQELYRIGREYSVKYHSAPTADQIKELVRLDNKQDTLTNDLIDILYASASNLNQYTDDWLFDSVSSWAQWKNFTGALVDTVTYVKLHQDDVTTENVKEICEKAKGSFNRQAILDIKNTDNKGLDFFDANSHKEVKLKRMPTGIDYIDKCLKGGTWAGSLIGFAGAPKVGKSLWLQNICAEAVKAGRNCLYISLELPEEMIVQRIGANLLNIPSLEYEKYGNDFDLMKQKLQEFKNSLLNPPGYLRVVSFPTSTLTTIEMESFILKLEEELSTDTYKFHFDHIYLDYINIMKNYRNPNSEDTYQKIKMLAEDVRAIAVKNNWCVLTATQTNRSQFDSTDMTANQISESAGFGATVDALFGIIADQIQKSMGIYYLKCLLDRVCPMENTRKKFNVDKTYLRIREDMTAVIETAEDIYKSVTSGFKNYKTGVDGNTGHTNVMPNPHSDIRPDLNGSSLVSTPPPPMTNLLDNSDIMPNTEFSGQMNQIPAIVTGANLF